MPTIMLNETQTSELIEALEHAEEIVKNTKKDASVVSVGSNSWVAMQTEPGEYYNQTLVRVCFTKSTGDRYSYMSSKDNKVICIK